MLPGGFQNTTPSRQSTHQNAHTIGGHSSVTGFCGETSSEMVRLPEVEPPTLPVTQKQSGELG